MNKLSRNNMQEFCRICLSSLQSGRSKDRRSMHKRYDLNVLPQLREIYTTFTTLDISEDDDEDLYPRSLCQRCYDKMIDFQEFRILAINSAEVLCKIVYNLNDDNKENDEDENSPKPSGSEDEHSPKPSGSVSRLQQHLQNDEDAEMSQQELIAENDTDEEEPMLRNRTKNNSNFTVKMESEYFKQKREGVPKKKVLKCPFCDTQTYKQVYLDAHICAVHEGSSSFGLEQMVEWHPSQFNTENKSEEWICQLCSKNFHSKHALRKHQRRHSKVRSHICNVCGIGKVTNSELQIHMRTHNPNLAKFKCPLCPQEFNHKNAISRHVRVIHEGQKNFPCSHCEKRFGTRTLQVAHERRHTGERPYSCNMCHKAYPTKDSLKSHMKTHDKNLCKHICSICSKRFGTKTKLIDHERRHQGDKQHICNACSRGFASVADLNEHKRTHTTKGTRVDIPRSSKAKKRRRI